MITELNNENFLMYAIKHYDNPSCGGIKEFEDDLKRLRYIKRLIGRYKATGDIKERLIINHIVVLYNVFGAQAASNMLFFKIQDKFWPQLKPFLVFLNLMPEFIAYRGNLIKGTEVPLDTSIVEILRKI